MLTRICAWCKKPMGTKDGPDGATHGICDDCSAKELEKAKQLAH